jgi:hypothetical protein
MKVPQSSHLLILSHWGFSFNTGTSGVTSIQTAGGEVPLLEHYP